MTIWQTIALGLVQGMTEFLPISSSAHLVLVPWLMGWPDPGLSADIALHWGTLIGVVVYFSQDIRRMIIGFFGSLRGSREFENRLPWLILLATVPGALIGFLFESYAETTFRSPWIIAGTLSGLGLYLWFGDRPVGDRRPLNLLRWQDALFIGVAQGLAVVPGVSRSGITIATALLLKMDRTAAVRFSFFLSIPIILGAGLLKVEYLVANAGQLTFWAGVASSAFSGMLALHFLLTYVRTRSFMPFVIYRFGLAAVIIAILLTGRRIF